MNKSVAIFLICLAIISCKKDTSLFTTNNSTKTNSSTTISSISSFSVATATISSTFSFFNIKYKLWNPYDSITIPCGNNSCGCNCTNSLIISLDSIINHKIKLLVTCTFQGWFGGGMPTPIYNNYAQVISEDSSVFVANGTNNHTNILTNSLINDNLDWGYSLDLRNSIMYGGNLGAWDLGGNNGYVGVKIISTSGNKYGWIKLNVPDWGHMTIEAQALNNNYGQYIPAGQTH